MIIANIFFLYRKRYCGLWVNKMEGIEPFLKKSSLEQNVFENSK